jgi:hypothetical protein
MNARSLPLTPIFVFRIRCERGSRVCSKQKCPGKAVGIHFNWRGERDKFRTFLGKI